MKLLTITYKRCYHVNGRHYTTGGSPKEFNALPERLEFYLLAEFLERDRVEAAWTLIDPRVRCFSLGKIVQWATFPPPVAAMIRTARMARKIVAEHGIDIVLMKGPSEVSMAPLLTLRKFKIPLVYHYSLDWVQDVIVSGRKSLLRRLCYPYFLFTRIYRRAVGAFVFPRADALATVATPYAEKLNRYKPNKVYLLPSTFTTSENQIVKEPAPKDISRNHFLFVGRIDRNKNLQLIVRALAILKKTRPDRKVVVDIVGEGDEYADVVKLAGQFGVADQLNHVGYVRNDDLQPYYTGAFALLLPSFSELLPKVVIESFTAGTPVIASKVGGIPDMLRDGHNGYFIDPHDPRSLADKMTVLMDDVQIYRALQNRAADTAHKFSRESTLDKWMTTFEKITGEYSG
ncbi:MAG: glycosyltransferase [candidate division Zixibacteria bacterium]|nr:glycosyltransferase [candidate division Zixibacteria bacterium]